MMRRFIFAAVLFLSASYSLFAQTDSLQRDSVLVDSLSVVPEGFRYADSLVCVPVPRYTDSLKGKDIFAVMPCGVTVNQSEELLHAVQLQVEANFADTLESNGYRIRIFFDNRQDAREASKAAQERSQELFPGYRTYRTYIYPNFKVTVGDFRTRAEAQMALREVQRHFPSAFVVRERMKFPSIALSDLYTVDTLKVLVPLEQQDEQDLKGPQPQQTE